MKTYLLFFLVLFCSACSTNNADTKTNTNTATAESVNSDKSVLDMVEEFSDEQRKDQMRGEMETAWIKCEDACACAKSSKIAKIMGWTESAMKLKTTQIGDRTSVCAISHNIDNLLLRLSKTNPQAKNPEMLKKNFAKLLAEGESNYTYKEISASPEQVIIGIAKDEYGQNHWIVRKRFGNNGQIRAELVKVTEEVDLYTEKILDLVELMK